MCDNGNCIPAALIQKLTHKIAEIRERALFCIISKLEDGFVFDNNLQRTRELLYNLFNWFLFEPCTNEDHALDLIKQILQTPAGKLLANHIGKDTIKAELEKIQSFINPKFHEKISEVLSTLSGLEALVFEHVPPVVPPFKNDIPLSYRSNFDSGWSVPQLSPVLETATTIEGLVEKGSSHEPQLAYLQSSTNGTMDNKPTYRLDYSTRPAVLTLTWQPLIETDRNVLQSVENSLKNPQDSSMLFHSCEFFVNVLLHDFPAEVFIQRPGIIIILYELLSTCHSTKLSNIILQCFFDLSRALQIRINQCNDPGMKNLKTEMLPNLVSSYATPPSSYRNSEIQEPLISDQFESAEEAKVLKNAQFTVADYCFRTMNVVLKCMGLKVEKISEHQSKLNQVGQTLSLTVLNELVILLNRIFGEGLWGENETTDTLLLLKETNKTLAVYADLLTYFRVESLSLKNNLTCRVIYLYLLCISARWLRDLIPLSKTKQILPANFKDALSDSLLDISLGRLYPKVHSCLLQFVESFSSTWDKASLNKYENTMKVCDGLSSTVRFLRGAGKLTVSERLRLAYSAMPGVEFHRNLQFVESFVDLCSEKLYSYRNELDILKLAKDTILQLLAHRIPEIQEEMYRLCHRKVVDNIGTQTNFTNTSGVAGAQVYFLLNSEILTEVTLFGLKNQEVKQYAEEILLYILKCKIIVAEPIWASSVEALIPLLPIILCYAGNATALGRTIVNIVDPDTSKTLLIPDLVTLKSNIELLFACDSVLRDEAVSRLCWLLAKQDDSKDILPKFNTIFERGLSTACCIKNAVVDVNKLGKSGHFYQVSSLHQVLDLLKSENVEPVMRRSALNQVSVMMDDYLLHDLFIEASGLELVIDSMKRALRESDFRDYPDSVIPIVSILKSLALYHSNVREELSENMDVLFYTLRGLFLFFTDDRMRLDASTLLFLLVFKDYLSGTPSRATFSIPALVMERLYIPFIANTHSNVSPHSPEELFSNIIQDKWSLSSLQIQWNADLYDGFTNLVTLNENKFPLPQGLSIAASEVLKLEPHDLAQIKSSSIHYCFQKYLFSIQSATSHNVVRDSISKLILYLQFYQVLNESQNNQLLSHPWEKSFARYLEVLPSSDEDIGLLNDVIKLLVVLLPFYKDSSEECWISKFLKNPNHCLLDILAYENNGEEIAKLLSQDLLKLVTLCVTLEHRYLDCYLPNENRAKNSRWYHVIKIIAENLQYNNTQHFYNLAYLDALLSCLVHLTARLGWSQSRAGGAPAAPIPQLVSGLCELLTAFHCGKGDSATVSVMGLSISRNVLIIVNHLLAEMQHSKVKRWEECFFDNETRFTKSFLAMWASRDVILRAAAVQLFGNLSNSPKAAQEISRDLAQESGNIWELAMTVLTDQAEAGIVRENAALLLSNLCNHLTFGAVSNVSTAVGFLASTKKQDLLSLLDEFDFYNHLDIILASLFTLDFSVKTSKPQTCMRSGEGESLQSNSSGSEPREFPINASTPGLIKTVSIFLYNIIDVDPKGVSGKLLERGLIKLIFRIICVPSIAVYSKKELALYCDILDMNSRVCSLLRKVCSVNVISIGTVLHTRDCLDVLFTLLNAKNFQTHLLELLYLRNKLWSEAFSLIAILLEGFNDDELTPRKVESLSIISETIEHTGVDAFLDSLCESLGSVGCNDLQNSALLLLVALLRVECDVAVNKRDRSISISYSIETILDTVRSPKTVFMSTFRDNVEVSEPLKPRTKSFDSGSYKSTKSNILEEAYFGKVIKEMRRESSSEEIEISIVDSSDDALMVGAELCKILLYLFDIINIKLTGDGQITRKKSLVISALTGLLCISQEAKKLALEKHLLETTIKDLRELHIRLSLESVEQLRRVQDKKRLMPVVQEAADLVGLLTNFMLNNAEVKRAAAALSLADVLHKLWIWFLFQNSYVVDVLKLLSIYTLDCPEACRSLPLTSAIAGAGPRKTPSNVSLLHSIITLISKEMEQISRSHELSVLELAFDVLHHCCDNLECRVIISKSNLFQSMSRLHPAVTKRQFPWDSVELLWLEFLQTYTRHPEGQSTVAKENDLLDIVIGLAQSSKENNRREALMVLRNVTFYQPNRPRLLTSGDFLNLLQLKLASGSCEEKKTVVVIMWSLAANNQKAKLVFKSAKLDSKLENLLKRVKLVGNAKGDVYEKEDLELMELVLGILRGDKTRCRVP